MEKFKKVNTHHFLTERMTEMENPHRPVCCKIYRKSVNGAEILEGSLDIVPIAVDVAVQNGGQKGKDVHYFAEINRFVEGEMCLIYLTDIGSSKSGLPGENGIERLVDMACNLLKEIGMEDAIPNYNHADFIKRMGFPFSVAVRVDDDGNEEPNGLFCVINSNYDVICESAALVQAETICNSLNSYANRDIR